MTGYLGHAASRALAEGPDVVPVRRPSFPLASNIVEWPDGRESEGDIGRIREGPGAAIRAWGEHGSPTARAAAAPDAAPRSLPEPRATATSAFAPNDRFDDDGHAPLSDLRPRLAGRVRPEAGSAMEPSRAGAGDRDERDRVGEAGAPHEATPADRLRPSVEHSRREPPIAAGRTRVVGTAIAREGPRARERDGHLDGATAPVVHVSIGRIEVRAVREERPVDPDPPALRRPDLSLEDYLRRREEIAR